jgi:hypothetical protein
MRQSIVQQIIEFVIPGDDGSGCSRDEQEAGDRQASPTMKQKKDRSHGAC